LSYGASVFSMLAEQSVCVTLEGADFRPDSQRRRLSEVRSQETRPIS